MSVLINFSSTISPATACDAFVGVADRDRKKLEEFFLVDGPARSMRIGAGKDWAATTASVDCS
jgi:hypothetical protein